MPLYHFTDQRNLESIRKYGLHSWKRLVAAGKPHVPASNGLSRSLDLKAGLEDYVRLSVRNRHPMATFAASEGRVEKVAWLVIDDRILDFGRRLYSDRNATDKNAIINGDPETALRSDHPQAEVLVYGFVQTRWIRFPPQKL